MKKIICFAASLLALTLTPVFGQQSIVEQMAQHQENAVAAQKRADASLTKFNLDFPGGTPAELVKAIEKAMDKPLNVIIPSDDTNFKLPPLKLHDVTFPQLSETMRQCSFTTVWVVVGQGPFGQKNYTSAQTGYYFKTTDVPPTDNSVWFFYAQKPPAPQPVEQSVRFYSLAPYLDRGFTVDDITTAIQTGWKMAGITSPPELDYHKETKLLIAFGEPNELQTIQDVLNTLPQNQYNGPPLSIQMGLLQNRVGQLQDQLNVLKEKISTAAPSPMASPKEKSGK